jgi:hypothetical protein
LPKELPVEYAEHKGMLMTNDNEELKGGAEQGATTNATVFGERAFRIELLFLMCIIVPCLFLTPVSLGCLPWIFLLLLSAYNPLLILFTTIPIIIFGVVYWFLAKWIAEVVWKIPFSPLRLGLAVMISAAIFFLAFFPVYGHGHGGMRWYYWHEILHNEMKPSTPELIEDSATNSPSESTISKQQLEKLFQVNSEDGKSRN